MPSPIVPPSKYNPTGTTTIQRRTDAELTKRMRAFYKGMRDYIETIPYTTEDRASNWIDYDLTGNQTRYVFQLNPQLLQGIDQTISQLIRIIFFDGQDDFTAQHFFAQAAELGYESGARSEVRSLQAQTGGEYIRTLDFVLRSQPYRARVAFVGARAFEDLKGFTDDMRGKLRTILTQGMAMGRSPNELARQIRTQVLGDKDGKTKGAIVRSKLLARTEITNAHRRAIYDEHMEARNEGVEIRLMHISALLPDRTRRTHAARHGKLFTVEEQEEWYSKDGNAISCLCSVVSVSTDKDGNPLNRDFVERQQKRRKKFLDTVEPRT